VINILLGLLGILFLYFLFYYVRDMVANKDDWGFGSWTKNLIIGAVTNFFDTLGIGSYATTTMLLSVTKQLKNDKLLPGTLNVADTIPVMIEAFFFITVIKVDAITLFSLIVAAILGAVIGGKTVPKFSEKKVQTYLGIALIITALLMLGKQLGMMDFLGTGNTALGLDGVKLVVAVVLNFIFGALMTIGCGLYAPCMAMVYMLGLNPIVAFPVMMGSCAALMPVASKEFIVVGDYARRVSLAIAIGGIPGVIIAAKFVVSMDLNLLTWLVIFVVIYTGILYIRKGIKNTEK
jgi:uncharacterized membrane protein YfcA